MASCVYVRCMMAWEVIMLHRNSFCNSYVRLLEWKPAEDSKREASSSHFAISPSPDQFISQLGGFHPWSYPKWMAHKGKSHLENGWFGGPDFRKPPICHGFYTNIVMAPVFCWVVVDITSALWPWPASCSMLSKHDATWVSQRRNMEKRGEKLGESWDKPEETRRKHGKAWRKHGENGETLILKASEVPTKVARNNCWRIRIKGLAL